jgi:predicted nucleic acid-binding protein
MTSVVVDTNVLISFLTDRNEKQQELAQGVLQAAADRELDLMVHQQVLTELIYVLLNVYGQRRERVSEVVRDLVALPGVCIVDTIEWSRVFDLWPDPFSDFTDAVLAVSCETARNEAIVTFDEDFKRRLIRLGLSSFW